MNANGKYGNITLIYCSQSQSSDEFCTFNKIFQLLLDNIANRNSFVSIIVDGFNATSKNWCSGDKTTYEPKKI